MVSDLTFYRKPNNNCCLTKDRYVLPTIDSLNLSTSQSSPELSVTIHSSSKTSQSTVRPISTLTDNTLSMVSTPWSTESWYSMNHVLNDLYSNSMTSSSTMMPMSTSSGGCTPECYGSKNTITILRPEDPFSNASFTVRPLQTVPSRDSTSTLSSWTVESFVSPVKYSNSEIIKVKYPWSPCTFISGTDLYPSTMDTFNSASDVATLTTADSVETLSSKLTSSAYRTFGFLCLA
ncbi:unnamed protein product [Danaus chrysippus]|uniref:(African queen) hypothetical protein n=1 Tax=Danaus chrysippus TaxID=151541 RepID=A0A8J2QM40_9NEOP|nr:unnamed protein product [Danaus chrysippus]